MKKKNFYLPLKQRKLWSSWFFWKLSLRVKVRSLVTARALFARSFLLSAAQPGGKMSKHVVLSTDPEKSRRLPRGVAAAGIPRRVRESERDIASASERGSNNRIKLINASVRINAATRARARLEYVHAGSISCESRGVKSQLHAQESRRRMPSNTII